ncbi:MAG: hypothetical protein ABFC56_04240 [Clostridiaceae bacterium]
MNRNYDVPATFPSLEATMNFGQFGCANLIPDNHAVRMSHTRDTQKAERARAKGFQAYLSGRTQRI